MLSRNGIDEQDLTRYVLVNAKHVMAVGADVVVAEAGVEVVVDMMIAEEVAPATVVGVGEEVG